MSEIALTPEQEVSDAEALYGALEERIREGDATVTPDELDKARGLARFAKLRAQAAERAAEKARQEKVLEDAKAAVAAAVKAAKAMDDGADRLAQLQDAAVASMTAYLDAARTGHEALWQVMRDVADAQATAAELGIPGPDAAGVTMSAEELIVTPRSGKAKRVALATFTLREAGLSMLERSGVARRRVGGVNLSEDLVNSARACNKASLSDTR